MNTCQIQQITKTLKFVPANNSSLKVVWLPLLMADNQMHWVSTQAISTLSHCLYGYIIITTNSILLGIIGRKNW